MPDDETLFVYLFDLPVVEQHLAATGLDVCPHCNGRMTLHLPGVELAVTHSDWDSALQRTTEPQPGRVMAIPIRCPACWLMRWLMPPPGVTGCISVPVPGPVDAVHWRVVRSPSEPPPATP